MKVGCCMHGRPLLTACRRCQAMLDRDCAAFDRDVFFGVYDQFGYTPAERKAQRKRDAATQNAKA